MDELNSCSAYVERLLVLSPEPDASPPMSGIPTWKLKLADNL